MGRVEADRPREQATRLPITEAEEHDAEFSLPIGPWG